MRRREFIAGLGGVAAWPLVAHAQRPGVIPVIGYIGSRSAASDASAVRAFGQGLSEVGYVEGLNVTIEYRRAEGRYDRLVGLATDLVRRQVSVVAALGGVPAALAAKAATTTIPIVFEAGLDPIGSGLVDNLSRPSGNVTGVTSLNVELAPKLLEMLHQMVPSEKRIAVLLNPANPNSENLSKQMAVAGRALGVEVSVLSATNEREIDEVFATQLRVGALVITTDAFFLGRSGRLAALTFRHGVPAMSPHREFAAAGGLMSYGTNLADAYRLAGVYVGRILKGEKPIDLPVQQVSKIELVLNLNTAKSLGLMVPPQLLVRADEVIE